MPRISADSHPETHAFIEDNVLLREIGADRLFALLDGRALNTFESEMSFAKSDQRDRQQAFDIAKSNLMRLNGIIRNKVTTSSQLSELAGEEVSPLTFILDYDDATPLFPVTDDVTHRAEITNYSSSVMLVELRSFFKGLPKDQQTPEIYLALLDLYTQFLDEECDLYLSDVDPVDIFHHWALQNIKTQMEGIDIADINRDRNYQTILNKLTTLITAIDENLDDDILRGRFDDVFNLEPRNDHAYDFLSLDKEASREQLLSIAKVALARYAVTFNEPPIIELPELKSELAKLIEENPPFQDPNSAFQKRHHGPEADTSDEEPAEEYDSLVSTLSHAKKTTTRIPRGGSTVYGPIDDLGISNQLQFGLTHIRTQTTNVHIRKTAFDIMHWVIEDASNYSAEGSSEDNIQEKLDQVVETIGDKLAAIDTADDETVKQNLNRIITDFARELYQHGEQLPSQKVLDNLDSIFREDTKYASIEIELYNMLEHLDSTTSLTPMHTKDVYELIIGYIKVLLDGIERSTTLKELEDLEFLIPRQEKTIINELTHKYHRKNTPSAILEIFSFIKYAHITDSINNNYLDEDGNFRAHEYRALLSEILERITTHKNELSKDLAVQREPEEKPTSFLSTVTDGFDRLKSQAKRLYQGEGTTFEPKIPPRKDKGPTPPARSDRIEDSAEEISPATPPPSEIKTQKSLFQRLIGLFPRNNEGASVDETKHLLQSSEDSSEYTTGTEDVADVETQQFDEESSDVTKVSFSVRESKPSQESAEDEEAYEPKSPLLGKTQKKPPFFSRITIPFRGPLPFSNLFRRKEQTKARKQAPHVEDPSKLYATYTEDSEDSTAPSWLGVEETGEEEGGLQTRATRAESLESTIESSTLPDEETSLAQSQKPSLLSRIGNFLLRKPGTSPQTETPKASDDEGDLEYSSSNESDDADKYASVPRSEEETEKHHILASDDEGSVSKQQQQRDIPSSESSSDEKPIRLPKSSRYVSSSEDSDDREKLSDSESDDEAPLRHVRYSSTEPEEQEEPLLQDEHKRESTLAPELEENVGEALRQYFTTRLEASLDMLDDQDPSFSEKRHDIIKHIL